MALINQFLQAQQRFQLELLAKSGVVGVGIGYKNQDNDGSDELSLIALVEQKKPRVALREKDLVPPDLDGAKTDVIEVGLIQAQPTSRDKWRPSVPLGVSLAHYMVTAGTLGAIVYGSDGTPYLLSNNHVLANANDALIGDPILQPSPVDNGDHPQDAVANLYRYAKLSYVDENIGGDANPIIGKENSPSQPPNPNSPSPHPLPPTAQQGGCAGLMVSLADSIAKANDPNVSVQVVRADSQTASPIPRNLDPSEATTVEAQAVIPDNLIDAALARPTNAATFDPAIREIGTIEGTMPVTLGMPIRKYGRTTGLTTGTVTLINATIDVSYNTITGKRTARFIGQILASSMSQGGDSGSLIVDANSQNAVGLLFAGSPKATIFTPIARVLNKFNVSLVPPTA